MRRIESFEEYKEAVLRAKAAEMVFTNCYLLPSSVKEMIGAGNLFILERKGFCLILKKEDAFFRIWYYLSQLRQYDRLVLELPAVVEYVFQGELSEGQRKEIRKLEELGFDLGRESGRMDLDAKTAAVSHFPASDVTEAKQEDADAVHDLIVEYFNPLYAYIPSRQELLEGIGGGDVLVVYRDREIAGALYAERNKKTASIRQLTVSEKYRSCGYAKQLVEAYHRKYHNQVNSFTHWVDLGNNPAIRLYKAFGYSFDGRKANEYILLPQEESTHR